MPIPSRALIFSLASFLVVSLVYVTWQSASIASWIVYNDHVWAEMDRTGHHQEHRFAERLHFLRLVGIVWIEIGGGLIFLAMLARRLFAGVGEEK